MFVKFKLTFSQPKRILIIGLSAALQQLGLHGFFRDIDWSRRKIDLWVLTDFFAMLNLFRRYKDIFAWEYSELTGIPANIGVHQIKLKPGSRPVRQAARRIKPDLMAPIKAEIMKLHSVDFIYPVKTSEWLSSMVPVRKPLAGKCGPWHLSR